MSKKFSTIVEKAIFLQGDRSTSQFARDLGMQQSTLDLYLKGKRKPSVEFVYCICRRCAVSADWLLGLTDAAESPTVPPPDAALSALRDEVADLARRIDAALSRQRPT